MTMNMDSFEEIAGYGPATKKLVKKMRDFYEKTNEGHTCQGVCFDTVLAGMLKDDVYILSRVIESFWGNMFRNKTIPEMERVYSALVKNKCNEKSPRNYNDMDDDIWYIPDPKRNNRRIVCYTDQSTNLLFVWEKGMLETIEKNKYGYGKFHVRSFWPKYKIPSKKDKIGMMDHDSIVDNLKQGDVEHAIHYLDLSKYSDDVKDPYLDRPSLDWFKEKKFGFEYDDSQYGDGRDKGYIATYDLTTNKVEWSHSHYVYLKTICGCIVPCMVGELFNEEVEFFE